MSVSVYVCVCVCDSDRQRDGEREGKETIKERDKVHTVLYQDYLLGKDSVGLKKLPLLSNNIILFVNTPLLSQSIPRKCVLHYMDEEYILYFKTIP